MVPLRTVGPRGGFRHLRDCPGWCTV